MKKYSIIVFVNIIMVFCMYVIGFNYFEIIKYLFLINILVYISYVDAKKRIIPNKSVAVIFAAALIFIIYEYLADIYTTADLYSRNQIIISYALGGLVCGGIMLATWLINRKSIGMGDIKLMTALGFYLGFERIISCMILSIVLLAVCSILLLIMKKIKIKDSLPFAPFAALSVIIILLLGL